MRPPAKGILRSKAFGLALALVAIVGLVVVLLRGHPPSLDIEGLRRQLSAISWLRVGLAVLCVYAGYWLRARRWAVLLSPIRPATANELLPAQLIGFAAVGLFGRVVDLGRPYMIARRTGTPVATQLAIYSVERAFDLGAAAILFSVTLALSPRDMPHHQAFVRAGALALIATLLVVSLALALRLRGEALARLAGRALTPLSSTLATGVSARVLDLRHGFRTVASVQEFVLALGLSLVMWVGIACSYLLSALAFRASPELAAFTFTATMLLLASGLGGSLLQLPILGWFTQIAILSAALHGFFAVPLETATACGTIIQLVTNLSVIPLGLIAARVQGISLRQVASSASPPVDQ